MDEQQLPEPTAVEVRKGYRLWLRYSDGASGEVDLSHLAGKGVFAAWNDRSFFEQVRITPHCSIAWGEGDDFEICPDALYMEITGKTVEELMPRVAEPPNQCLNSAGSTESSSTCITTTTGLLTSMPPIRERGRQSTSTPSPLAPDVSPREHGDW